MLRRLRGSIVAAMLAGCAVRPAPIVDAPATERARTDAVAPAPLQAVPPTAVPDLLAAVPREASLVVSSPAFARLYPNDHAMKLLIEGAWMGLGPSLGLRPELLERLAPLLDGGVVFALGPLEGDTAPRYGALLRLREPSAASALLRASNDRALGSVVVLEPAAVLLAASSSDVLQSMLGTLARERPAIASASLAWAADGTRLRALADLHALAPSWSGVFARGASVEASVGPSDASLTIRLVGPKIPRVGALWPGGAHALAPHLPAGAVVAADLATVRAPGTTLRDTFDAIGVAIEEPAISAELDQELARIGTSIGDVEAALGDDVAIGLYAGSGPWDEALRTGTMFGIARNGEAAAIDKLLAVVRNVLTVDPRARVTARGFTVGMKQNRVFAVRRFRDAVAFAVGPEARIEALAHEYEAAESGRATRPAASDGPPSLLSLVVDPRPLAALGAPTPPGSGPAGFDVVALPTEDGIELAIRGERAGDALGALAAAGLHGARRYARNAKVAEARNTLGALVRGAVAAYERESSDNVHRLCESAPPVPRRLPAGTTYQPSSLPGADFETGDERAGWYCLRFTMRSAIRYQYEYRRGGPYKGPPRGGPNPGPSGFEVSAEGDLDGDGATSLFTMTGTIEGGEVRVASPMFVSDEYE